MMNELMDREFITHLTMVIETHLSDEQFGVLKLADKMNMSRSNLLCKVKKIINQPPRQLIREIRLKRAVEMLMTTSHNVSEISHQVGFSSTSYFIKCFRERFGHPPAEWKSRKQKRLIIFNITNLLHYIKLLRLWKSRSVQGKY